MDDDDRDWLFFYVGITLAVLASVVAIAWVNSGG